LTTQEAISPNDRTDLAEAQRWSGVSIVEPNSSCSPATALPGGRAWLDAISTVPPARRHLAVNNLTPYCLTY
jgi:hypothetical protein